MNFNWPKFSVNFDVKSSVILMCLAGSRAYGTDHPDSDTDWKGILIPPKDYILSPFKSFDQIQWKGGETGRVSEIFGTVEADEEGTVFGIQKFVKLAASSNPNVIETLFIDEKHIAFQSEAGKELRENRYIFLSERACKTFTGYAMSQLKRIKSHKSWIDSPPRKSPIRSDFDLEERKLISGEQMGAARSFITRNMNSMAPWLLDSDNQHKGEFWEGVDRIVSTILTESGYNYDSAAGHWLDIEDDGKAKVASSLGFDDNFVQYLQNEKKYAQAKQHYQQYQSWLKNRNPARADLEARYGYDAKHAMHLVRLLRMGEEILTTGDFDVYRPDRQELKEIRNGSWAYEDLIDWSEIKVKELYALVRDGKSAVTKHPDENAIEELTIRLQEKHWKNL